jgi:hypothetical protein
MRYSQARSFRREAVSDLDVCALDLVIDWAANRALRQLCPQPSAPPPAKHAPWWKLPAALAAAAAVG